MMPSRPIQALVNKSYPTIYMALSLQYHWACRFLQAGDSCSMPVQVTRNILAGRFTSTSKAMGVRLWGH